MGTTITRPTTFAEFEQLPEPKGAGFLGLKHFHLLDAALALSTELRHPIYDCVYLALANRPERPLVVADMRLARAVRKRNLPHLRVTLLDELGRDAR